MNQPIKRRNPFETVVKETQPEKPVEEQVLEEEKDVPVENEPVNRQYNEEYDDEPVKVVQRTQKNTPKTRVIVQDDDQREKYTSTMEVTLRRKIKIVCATRGIMFSEFIEDACREKLRREGER